MKRTKNFFIALLGFCLMGSGVMAQTYYDEVVVSKQGLTFVVYENADGSKFARVKATSRNVDSYEIPGSYSYEDFNTEETLELVVIGLEPSAFSAKKSLVSVSLPATITDIPESAFNGCEALKEINLGNINTVGVSAFQNCKKLGPSLDLSKAVSVGASAFQGCECVTTLTIGDVELGDDAFLKTKVSNLTFVDVTTIPTGIATQFAGTLTSISIPESVTAISASAFSGCTGLESVDLKSVTSIGSSAFSGCTGLTSVDLSSVTTIGSSAFSGCTGLTSVDLSSVTSLGVSAFSGCGDYKAKKGLKEVAWPAAVTSVPDGTFDGCAMLSTIKGLFDVATDIGEYAFYNTTSLGGTVTFSDKLESVGAGAFASSGVSVFVFNADCSREGDSFATTATTKLIIDNDKLYSAGNTYDQVTYSRSKTGTYGALVLPFNFEKGNNTYYTFTSYDEQGMHFTEVEGDELQANTPYLYEGDDAEFNSTGTYTTEALPDDVSGAAPAGWTSNGVYKDYSDDPITSNGYMWAVQNGALKWFQTLKIKPYRAYWKTDNSNVSSNARVLVHTRDGNVTSINMAEIDGLENLVPVYYDLTGRMVNNPVKGSIYIVNGKKVVF